MLNVRMHPNVDAALASEGGISTLIRAYAKHLPDFGVRLVETDDEADVIAIHAGVRTGVRNKPVVAHIHGLYWTAEDDALNDYHDETNAFVTQSIKEAQVVTVPSEWVANVLRRDMHLDPMVVPHGVDTEGAPYDDGPGAYVLWNKNRIGDACDPVAVYELATRTPGIKYQTTLWKYPWLPNVEVTGLLPHADMRQRVAGASVYLSTARETFGIGTLEALAAGVPVLGWANGGNLDLVAHKRTGYLAAPNDYGDLTAGLHWILANRQNMRASCRSDASLYTWRRATLLIAQAYRTAKRLFERRQSVAVTVVIPAYNKAGTLERAITSALTQTIPVAEVIVMDNNSTDDPQSVCDRFSERVTYANCGQQGVAHARNAGIALAGTPYVCCLDADDAIAPDFLATCLRALMDDPTLGAAYTGLLAVAPDGSTHISDWPGEYNFDAFLERRNQVPTCCVFRKDVWERLGGYRQRYAPRGAGAEDAEFFFRMGARGYPARKATNKPLFHYSLGVGATSQAGYTEVDWLYWHPFARDGKHPFASAATPASAAHPVRAYDAPVVSVVIPCARHHLDTLYNALDSLEAQTFREWEAIVVFDFKVDDDEYDRNVRPVLDAFPFARRIFTEAGGAGAARNIGAEMAFGTYLFFLDADDFLHPDALELLVEANRTDSYNPVVYSDYTGHAYITTELAAQLQRAGRLIAYDERDTYAHIAYKSFDYDCEKAVRQPESETEPYIWCLVSALVPRDYHERIGGFDEGMGSWEDWDYWLRMARAGICFRRIPERLVDYRFYSGTRREDGRQLAKGLLQYLKEKFNGEDAMPCGGCGRKRPEVQAQQSVMAGQRTPRPNFGGRPMNSEGLIMVRLNDNNVGQHHIVGGETRMSYGYRSHGDEFLMQSADYEARKDLFLLVEELDGEGEAQKPPPDIGSFEAVEGLSASAIQALRDAGVNTVADAFGLGREGLLALPHVGEVTAERIMEYAKNHLHMEAPVAAVEPEPEPETDAEPKASKPQVKVPPKRK